MHAYSIIAAVLLAAAPAVRATGKVTVKNMCSYPVYLQSVPGNSATQTLNANGGSYEETFRDVGDGGVSLKMSANSGLAEPIMQYEYTLEPNKLWYDISNVNGKAFVDGGYSLLSDNSNCQNVLCSAGNSNCQQTYNVYNDDFATNACPTSASQVFVLCSGQDGSKSPSSIASAVASAVFKGLSGAIGGGSGPFVASSAVISSAPASSAVVEVAQASPAVAEAAQASPAAAYSPPASPVVAAPSAPAVNTPQAAPQVTSVVASAVAAGPGDVYVTTMVTVYATETAVATATAEATVETESEPSWFGHIPEAHGRAWNSAKNRRHMHHMRGHEAEETEQS